MSAPAAALTRTACVPRGPTHGVPWMCPAAARPGLGRCAAHLCCPWLYGHHGGLTGAACTGVPVGLLPQTARHRPLAACGARFVHPPYPPIHPPIRPPLPGRWRSMPSGAASSRPAAATRPTESASPTRAAQPCCPYSSLGEQQPRCTPCFAVVKNNAVRLSQAWHTRLPSSFQLPEPNCPSVMHAALPRLLPPRAAQRPDMPPPCSPPPPLWSHLPHSQLLPSGRSLVPGIFFCPRIPPCSAPRLSRQTYSLALSHAVALPPPVHLIHSLSLAA